MKIVNLKEFITLPAGTVFAKYKPCCFDGLMVLDETWENDFIYSDLISNVECESSSDHWNKCDSMENGNSNKLDFECTSRDGCFVDDQLFAIYEKQDLIDFVSKLNKCLAVAYKEK